MRAPLYICFYILALAVVTYPFVTRLIFQEMDKNTASINRRIDSLISASQSCTTPDVHAFHQVPPDTMTFSQPAKEFLKKHNKKTYYEMGNIGSGIYNDSDYPRGFPLSSLIPKPDSIIIYNGDTYRFDTSTFTYRFVEPIVKLDSL